MDWDIDERSDDNEERRQALCPAGCGADHEVEPCAPGCNEDEDEDEDEPGLDWVEDSSWAEESR